MGRIFLIKFDQTPDNYFYVCRSCQAHIVLSEDYWYFLLLPWDAEQGLTGKVFDTAVNVHTLSPEHDRKVGYYTVADVYCNQCCNVLGLKIIQVPEVAPMVRVGYFVLQASKLLFWDGTDMVDAE